MGPPHGRGSCFHKAVPPLHHPLAAPRLPGPWLYLIPRPPQQGTSGARHGAGEAPASRSSTLILGGWNGGNPGGLPGGGPLLWAWKKGEVAEDGGGTVPSHPGPFRAWAPTRHGTGPVPGGPTEQSLARRRLPKTVPPRLATHFLLDPRMWLPHPLLWEALPDLPPRPDPHPTVQTQAPPPAPSCPQLPYGDRLVNRVKERSYERHSYSRAGPRCGWTRSPETRLLTAGRAWPLVTSLGGVLRVCGSQASGPVGPG